MGRGRYGETNNTQDTSSEPSSQPEPIVPETIETEPTSSEPTPEPSPTSQNISDVILENTDPDKGFLTSSGTYVNIYKNAGTNERVYTSDNTVKPAGERIDPRSNEGQIIQQQYADQADRRADNLAQSQRFWDIREGQGSVKNLLFASQTPEQRRLTEQFFEERNLDINTPLNELSLSPKRYSTAREQLTTGDVPEYGVKVPDSIWLKTDTPTQSELKSFEEYRTQIVKDAVDPKPKVNITGVGGTDPNTEFRLIESSTYDLNTNTWNPTPINDGQKQSAKELVDDARAQGFNFITITRERQGVPDSTITIPITGTNAYSKIENEFRKTNFYGQSDDKITVEGHVSKNQTSTPLPEDSPKIPMIDGVPYFLGGSLLFAQLVKNQDKINVENESGEIRQSYESWLAGEAPSTFTQMFSEDIAGTKISDYRQRPELGFASVPQQFGALIQGGVTGKLDETEFMDTALDSGIRVIMAFGGDKTKQQLTMEQEGRSRANVSQTYSGTGGIQGMMKQFEIEQKLWGAYGGYYTTSGLTELGLAFTTLGASLAVRTSAKVAQASVPFVMKVLPTLSVANQVKVAKLARVITKGSFVVPANLVFGGLGKAPSSKITVESVQQMSKVEAEAFGYGKLREVVTSDPFLKNIDIVPEAQIREAEELDAQNRLSQIDNTETKSDFVLMDRPLTESQAFDSQLTSELAKARGLTDDTLSQASADEKLIWQAEGFEGFPRLVDSPYTRNVKDPVTDGNEQVGLPVFYRDPISTQSPLMREINFGKPVSDEKMEGVFVSNFAELRTKPLTVRVDLKLVPDELPRLTTGMYDDMANTPLGFIDEQGVRVTGRGKTEQVLPRPDEKIGDDYVKGIEIQKLPKATISEIKMQNNQIRFRLTRGTEEYVSTTYLNPKTKKITQSVITGVNWSDFNVSKSTFVNPSPKTIQELMLIPDKGEDRLQRFKDFTDSETGVWKIAKSDDEKIESLMIKYLNDDRYLDDFGSVKVDNDNISSIMDFREKKLQFDELESSIKFRESKQYKFLNNLYAPAKSKVKNLLTGVNRDKKIKNIKLYESTLKKDKETLATLKTELQQSEKSAKTSVLTLWKADVDSSYIDKPLAQAQSQFKDISSDPLFFNLPKSIKSEERVKIAQITADTRYRDLSQEDFQNMNVMLSADEVDAVNNISRMNRIAEQAIQVQATTQTGSTAFGKSIAEYYNVREVLDKSQKMDIVSTGLTDDYIRVTMGVTDESLTSSQIMKRQDDVTKALLNIQGNQVNFNLSTTGISTAIRPSFDMRGQGKITEWTNPRQDIETEIKNNLKMKEESVKQKQELELELSQVKAQLEGVEKNIKIQKEFQINSDYFIKTQQEPVTPQELEAVLRIRAKSESILDKYNDIAPVVETLDSSAGKPLRKQDGTPDIEKVKPSTIEDVTGGWSDPDRGFGSETKSFDDLMRAIDSDKLDSVEYSDKIDDLLWNQGVSPPREAGTGTDGIVDMGKTADDTIAQMKRIEEQKEELRLFNQAKRSKYEADKWLEEKFLNIETANTALKDYQPQSLVKSSPLFTSGKINTNPINPQPTLWSNRIDTPEADYLRLLIKQESLNQQATTVDYKLGVLNKKIGVPYSQNQKATGLYSELEAQKNQAINKILQFEEPKLLQKAVSEPSTNFKDTYVSAPVKSDKQLKHLDYSAKKKLAQEIETSRPNMYELKQIERRYKYGTQTEKDAWNELMSRYEDVKATRRKELGKDTQQVTFAPETTYFQYRTVTSKADGKTIFDTTQGSTVIGQSQNLQRPTTIPAFMTIKQPSIPEQRLTRSLLESQEWKPFQGQYTNTLKKLESQIGVQTRLKEQSVGLRTSIDEEAVNLASFDPSIRIRVQLDQVAPNNRKLTALDYQRQNLRFRIQNIEDDIKKNLDIQDSIEITSKTLPDVEERPIQSMTQLGGQFSINTKGMKEEQARQLSYILSRRDTTDNFRVIESLVENNEYYKGNIYFENVYYDRRGTDLQPLKEPENMVPEQLQAWNKIKELEMKYDKSLAIKLRIGGSSDNVTTKPDDVIQEIEKRIKNKKQLGSQTNYGETADIYNIQTRQLDETMYKINTDGTPNTLDKTDPKLVAKYEKEFLEQLKSKYKKQEKLVNQADKLNEQRNELVAQLSRLEDGKSSPTYTANIYNTKTVKTKGVGDAIPSFDKKSLNVQKPIYEKIEYPREIPERIDSKTLERVKGFFKDNQVSVGIKKANLDNKIATTQNKIRKIDEKLNKLESQSDEVRTSGMESFLPNTNVREYDPLLRLDNDVSWMKDEGVGFGRGFDPEYIDPKGDARLVDPKPDGDKQKSQKVNEFENLQKILDRNAVNPRYGQTLPPFLPLTALRYPATTPQDIQDNVQLQEVPNIEFTPPQPQLDVKPDTRALDPFTPKPVSGFDTNIQPVTAQSADLGNVLSNAEALKLGIYPRQINKNLIPTVQQPPITVTDITQGFRQIQPVPALTKPLSLTGVATTPVTPIKPQVPVPLPVFNPYIPPTKKPRKKKPKTKKKKYRKIYWDVSSTPFKAFNPKEYYVFRNEPRSVKFKEKRKQLD